jgi:hypothetical protein
MVPLLANAICSHFTLTSLASTVLRWLGACEARLARTILAARGNNNSP